MHDTINTRKQPSALWLIGLCFFLFSFAQGWLISGALVLYIKSHFHLITIHAFAVFGSVATLFYMMPLLGGILIDKFGKQEAILSGSVFVIIGVFLASVDNYTVLQIGLVLLLTGAALVVPAYFCCLSDLYGEHDVRRDSGFTLMYLMINAAFFISLLIGSFVARHIGFSLTTKIIDSIILLSIVSYFLVSKKISQQSRRTSSRQLIISKRSILLISSYILVLSALSLLPILFSILDYYFVGLILILSLIGGWMIFRKESNQSVRSKIILFYILCFISLGFWVFYFLEPMLLTVFSKDNLNLHFLGIDFPAASVFSLDSFFVIVTGLFLTWLWVKLELKHKNPSLPTKFTLAPLWVALGYIVLILEIYWNHTGLMPFYWIMLAYFLFTLGELFLAPTGFSMAGKLAPQGREGFFMGVWQVSIGGAATISSLFASLLVMPNTGSLPERNIGYMHSFLIFAGIGVGLFLIALILLKWMKRLTTQ